MNEGPKPFCISKEGGLGSVSASESRTRDRQASMDKQIEDFEKRLKRNLYRIWNRMSSGQLLSTASQDGEDTEEEWRRKKSGPHFRRWRRIRSSHNQIVKARLEPEVDPHFHPDSYGYRPAKSTALDAVGQARQRCWPK